MSFAKVLIAGIWAVVLFSTAAMVTAESEMTIHQRFNTKNGELPAGWYKSSGSWRVVNGTLTVDSLKGEAYIFFGDENWQNYIIKTTATFVEVDNERRWLAILFRAAKDGSKPWSQFTVRYESTLGDGTEFAVKKESGWSVRQTCQAKEDSILSKPRGLRVVVKGAHVKAYLDGKPVIESHLCIERKTGCVGLGVSGCIAKFSDFSIRRLTDTSVKNERTNPKPCEVVAHRGFSAIAPENTIVSIRKAIEVGADGCEFDVRQCKDGTTVLMHDETVDRTTDGEGKVSDLNFTQIKKLDAGSWKYEKYAGERVPTLAEVLNMFKDSNCKPVIEIKTSHVYKEVVDAVRNFNMVDQAFVISFNEETLREIHTLEPDLKCVWLNSEKVAASPIKQARSIATRTQDCKTNIVGLDYTMLSPNLISSLHRQNIIVWTWTIDDPDVMDALIRWDIDAITTDRPNLAIKKKESRDGE